MTRTVRIAHFSDLHVALRPGLMDFNLNRVFSWSRWIVSRRRHVDYRRLEWTVDQVLTLKPDCVVLTGDLAHTGLDAELSAASTVLSRISDTGIPVFITGGNHDIYDRPSDRLELFHQIQLKHRLGVHLTKDGFCRFKELNLILLEQWKSNPFYLAQGCIDPNVLSSIDKQIKEHGIPSIHLAAGHFPVVDAFGRPLSFRKQMKGAESLRQFLQQQRSQVYLCGHCHTAFSCPLGGDGVQYCAGSITEKGVLNLFHFEEGQLSNVQIYQPEPLG